jgi:hypothetical protein
MAAIAFTGGPMKAMPSGQRFGKAGAFGQEAIARMHSFRSSLLARLDDLFSDQIGLRGRRRTDMDGFVSHLHKRRARIGVGIDRDGLDTHAAGGFDDPACDFATVCDEDFFEHYSDDLFFSCLRIRRANQWQNKSVATAQRAAGTKLIKPTNQYGTSSFPAAGNNFPTKPAIALQ